MEKRERERLRAETREAEAEEAGLELLRQGAVFVKHCRGRAGGRFRSKPHLRFVWCAGMPDLRFLMLRA